MSVIFPKEVMAKKKKVQETTIENYYDLKTDKIDELVAALQGDDFSDEEKISTDIKEITGEEINSRRRGISTPTAEISLRQSPCG